MPGMAPGAYVVLAFENKGNLDVRDDEIWRRLEKLDKKVEVAANGTAEVELKLIPANAENE